MPSCPFPCACCIPKYLPPCVYPTEDVLRPHRRKGEFDAHNPPQPRIKPDPRPPLPVCDGICACQPAPRPKKPLLANLKLRQLADCYQCRSSQECHNRSKTFYQRWQTYLDRLDPIPNTDYTQYCCDDYVDLGVNNDFVKYDRHLDYRRAPRTATLENFLFIRNVAAAHNEIQRPYNECAPYEQWCKYLGGPRSDPLGLRLEKSLLLRQEPTQSRWYELEMRPEPKGFVEGATIYKSRLRPFAKDTSFSTPITVTSTFPSGNLSPFKELRDVKKNM